MCIHPCVATMESNIHDKLVPVELQLHDFCGNHMESFIYLRKKFSLDLSEQYRLCLNVIVRDFEKSH